MKNIISKLIALANQLDEKGLYKEASEIDALISEATEQRKFDIAVKGRVAVKENVYKALGDLDEPPAQAHVKADASVTVKTVEGNQVTQKVVWKKDYSAKTLQELKNKMAADLTNIRSHYTPASTSESYEYYPVK